MTIHQLEPRARLLAPLPAAERRLNLAGVATPVLVGGDGPPVVLLHGPGANAGHWGAVMPDLVAGRRVIVPDLPGHGASEVTGGPLDAERVLEWLRELIEATCPTPPAIVGNALGGAIAARFAARHGDDLERLVLVDALGLAPFAPAPGFGHALQGFLAAPSEETHDELWRHCAHDLDGLRERVGEEWERFRAYNVDRARAPAVQAALGSLMQAFGFPAIAPELLDGIAVPTALIWGRHDLATPLAVAEDVAAHHGWPLQVIEGCADDPPVEQPEAFVRALRVALTALAPADAGFAAATELWNGMIDKRPAIVVQPTSTDDVVAALRFARGRGLPLSVRGGGHNVAGTALVDGGLVIDCSSMREVAVDPAKRTATVQPGCVLGDVDRATQEHGLATPLGFFSGVGVAGLTLGGGLGYLTRRFGWTVDNLLEVEIVTADGTVRRASRDEHPDLFWAVRGAGANLGVVTSFAFRLHPVGPAVYGGLIAWPFARAGEVLRAYRGLTSEAPRELAAWLLLFRAPPAPFVPAAWHGERICAMAVCYSGDLADSAAALAPIRALGEPIFDLLREQPYTELQSYLDGTEPKGGHYDYKTEYLSELSDEFLAAWQALAAECPIPGAEMGLLHLGGALNDRAGDDGAVGNRDARFAAGAIGIWEPDEPREEAFRLWLRDALERFRPFSTGGNYVNFQGADESDGRIRASYGSNYARVAEVKRAYDPDNVFSSNRNVRPR